MKLRSLGLLASLLACVAHLVHAGASQKVTEDFGPNPGHASFYNYVPDQVAPDPAILVVIHWCDGSAQAAYNMTSAYADLAEEQGFIIIYPGSSERCWDVSSPETLTHDGGGHSLGIVSMVRWTVDRYNGDRDRIFVFGYSSGAMMANVLLGGYPDVFAAGAAAAGVPYGCFAGPGFALWNAPCAVGNVSHTGAEWADLVKAAYPGYDGPRPKMQIFHGTDDQTINFKNLGEQVKQWTSVLGLDEAPTSITPYFPSSPWTRYVYGSDGTFEAYVGAGLNHTLPILGDIINGWFGLDC